MTLATDVRWLDPPLELVSRSYEPNSNMRRRMRRAAAEPRRHHHERAARTRHTNSVAKGLKEEQLVKRVEVTGRYSNRQIAQLATLLVDWALEQAS